MRIRSPSGSAVGSVRGAAPVATQHGVGLEGLASPPSAELDDDLSVPVEPAAARARTCDALALEPAADVGGLVGGELLDPLVDPARSTADLLGRVALVVRRS